jgi:N-acyl-D-amino-acid deacylase
VRILGGRILEVGSDLPLRGAQLIDVEDRWIAPGFIDVHSHSDNVVLLNPGLESKVAQGVTTEVVGNCGESLFPFRPERAAEFRQLVSAYLPGVAEQLRWDWTDLASWAKRVGEARPAIHLAPLVGHGSLRVAVSGLGTRSLTASEQSECEALLEEALDHGAFGISTGLAYPPGFAATPQELVSLIRQVAARDGVYATHVRDEMVGVFSSVDEALEVAHSTGVRLELSHLKIMAESLWGRSRELLEQLTKARRAGIRVRADQYPYDAAETGLFVILPRWALDGPWPDTLDRIQHPQSRARILEEIRNGRGGWPIQETKGGWDRLVISDVRTPAGRQWLRRSIGAIARSEGRHPAEQALKMLEQEKGDISVLLFAMDPSDVETIGEDPEVLIGSDGVGNSIESGPLRGAIHPRNYGTFPRFLRNRSGRGRVAIETAIHRMTGAAAEFFGIPDRGYLTAGRVADFVVWRFDSVDVGPEFGEPSRYSRFFESVWVCGEPALWFGEFTKSRRGEILRPVRSGSPSHSHAA